MGGKSSLGGPVGGAVIGGTISIGASVWVKIEKDKWEQQQSLSVDEEKTSGTGGGK